MGRAYMIGCFLIGNRERAAAAVCLFLLASAASIGAQDSQRQAEAAASKGGKMQFQINSTATSTGAETVGTGSYTIQKTDRTVKFTGYSTRGFPKEPAPLYLIFSYISCPIQGMPLFLSGMDAGDTWSHVTDKKEKAHVMLADCAIVAVPAGRFEDCLKHTTTYTHIAHESDKARAFLTGTRHLWFAKGVGLVMMVYEHSDGTKTQAMLTQYNVPGAGRDYLPLKIGNSWTYRWKNDYREQDVIEKCQVVAPGTEPSEPERPEAYPAVQISGQDRLDLKGVVLAEVGADSKKGFNYPYYLYVPDGVERGRAVHILAETNNTGRSSDDFEVHRRRAARLAADSHATKLARSLNVPLLVPVFPRPRSQWQAYTHSLDEDTLLIKTGPLKRIDLQLVKMIADARALLARSGLNVSQKVFMHGFSASGTFTNRFPILHPHIVQAVASGGVNGIPTFPASRWKDTVLPYPVGIADLKHITGIEFDKDAYSQVRQYIYMGSFDRNDTTMSRDCFSAEHVDLIWSLIGKPMDKRWETSKSIYRELGVSAQLVTYNGVSHEIRREMLNDIVKFFKANAGDSFVEIEPHQYPLVEYKQIKHAHIDGLYWDGDERMPQHKRKLPKGVSFIIGIEEWLDGQDHRQLEELKQNAGFEFTLRADGCKDIVITDENYAGTMNSISSTQRFKGFMVRLTPEQLKDVVPGKTYTIVPQNKSKQYTWQAREGVTLARP